MLQDVKIEEIILEKGSKILTMCLFSLVFSLDNNLSRWYYYFCLVKTGDYVDDRYIKVITGEKPSGGLVNTPSHFLYASIRFNN